MFSFVKNEKSIDTSKKTVTVDGIDVEWLDPDYKTFIDKTTIIYGTSGCGKSFLTAHILMNILDGHIPTAFLISPTNFDDYRGRIYNCATYRKLTKDFIGWLERLWERQEIPAKIYKDANNIEILRGFYQHVRTEIIDTQIKNVNEFRTQQIKKVECLDISPELRARKIAKIIEDNQTTLIKLYKTVVRRHRNALLQNSEISPYHRKVIEHLDNNPRVLLIFDDHLADLGKYMERKEIFKNLFFQGRHRFITQIHLIQNDMEVRPSLRKNAHITIFCNTAVANTFFNAASNGIDRKTKQQSSAIIEKILKDVEQPHRKLAYIKDSPTPFKHLTAEKARSGYFGSDAFKELCEKLEKDGETLNKDNEFVQYYGL